MRALADRLILFPRGGPFACAVLKGKDAEKDLIRFHLVGPVALDA